MPQHQLFQKIFKSNLNADGAAELINEVKNEYPFFAVANYFLLKKTEQHSPAYENIASTTALHFASPFHLNQLLSVKEEPTIEEPAATIAADEENITEDSVANTPASEENITEEPAATFIHLEEPTIEEPATTIAANQENITEDSVANTPASEENVSEEPAATFVHPEEPTIEEPATTIAANEIAANESEENSTEDEFPENEAVENTDMHEKIIQDISPELPGTEEQPAPEEHKNEPVAKEENVKEELLFEPLYTTDYFASQGIKLSEAVLPADKLGKQLKSFTDWLKTMKKTHENRLPEGSEQLDKTVQALAEKSNKEDDILTEAMAEAYQQQGKRLKAIEIYSKLSLLNPAKSAFFAAKIEQLK